VGSFWGASRRWPAPDYRLRSRSRIAPEAKPSGTDPETGLGSACGLAAEPPWSPLGRWGCCCSALRAAEAARHRVRAAHRRAAAAGRIMTMVHPWASVAIHDRGILQIKAYGPSRPEHQRGCHPGTRTPAAGAHRRRFGRGQRVYASSDRTRAHYKLRAGRRSARQRGGGHRRAPIPAWSSSGAIGHEKKFCGTTTL
jgi:hypothetical protein